MAYVPGVTNDVFISYARLDDAAAFEKQGWVCRFVADLSRVLKSRVGLGTHEEIKIYFDRRDLSSNAYLDELKENARRSAAFLPIISPSYVKRDWTREEMAAFREDGRSAGRIFAIENLPVEKPEIYPEPFESLARKEFWAKEENSHTAIPISPDDRRWEAKIHDIAREIKILLSKLREAGGVDQAIDGKMPGGRLTSMGRERTVLLAQVTDDLDEDREQIRRYLDQYGITCLPSNTYPQGGQEFIKALEADLANANFFVQLLGPLRSRHPRDLPQGYARCQYEAARRQASARPDFASLLWRRGDLDPTSVTNDDKALLSMPETLAMGLEAFKAEIKRRVEEANAPRQPRRNRTSAGDILVFVNAGEEDLQLALSVQKDFQRNGCTALLPVYDADAKMLRNDLEKKIIWCDALALVYGVAEPRWVSDQAMAYSKLKQKREEPARIVLICRGPPRPKKAHGVSMPGLREIDYVSGASDDPIGKIVSEIRQ